MGLAKPAVQEIGKAGIEIDLDQDRHREQRDDQRLRDCARICVNRYWIGTRYRRPKRDPSDDGTQASRERAQFRREAG
jgi:hypothetical protein